MYQQPEPSPTQNNPYIPKRRSLFGPLLLVTIGVLFLLRNFGILSHVTLAYWFATWWPLLLIILGIVRVVEWYLARKDGSSASGIGAGAVILIVFYILFGVTASAVHNADFGNLVVNDSDLPEFMRHFGQAHEFNESTQQEFTPEALVRVNNMEGDITVSTSPDDMLHVAARNVVYGNEENANRLEAESKPTITREGDVFVVRGSNNNRVRSNLQIEVPAKAILNLNTNYGKISVDGIQGNVHAYTAHGSVDLANLGGDASVDIHGESVNAQKVQGAVTITGRVDTVEASDTGSVDVGGEYLGSMTVERIQKKVHFHSPRSEMEIGDVRGHLNIGNDDVEGDDIGGPIQLRTEAKNIRLQNFSGDLSIQDSNGKIELEPKKLGTITVANHDEGIDLLLPDNAHAAISARTTGEGEITSDFSSLKPQSGENASHLTGNVGSGGPTITLTTDNGSIAIRKGTVTAEK